MSQRQRLAVVCGYGIRASQIGIPSQIIRKKIAKRDAEEERMLMHGARYARRRVCRGQVFLGLSVRSGKGWSDSVQKEI